MTLMQIRGLNLDQLTEAAKFLKTEAGLKRKAEMAAAVSIKKKNGAKMTAQEFWYELGAAKQRCQIANGPNWHLQPEAYIWGRIPAKLCSIKGQTTTHRRNRDQKIPIGIYWRNNVIPEVGIELVTTRIVART